MFAANGEYEIFYETFGERSGRPLLLVHGLGAQCTSWPAGLLEALVAAGLFVIRYDNRDVGLTTKSAPDDTYLLSDMARDGIAVLDAVGVDRAHVLGVSMGGMIVQTLAIEHPDRVASVTSVMSTTGDPALMAATSPEMIELLTTPPPDARDAFIEHNVAVFRAMSGPRFDEAVARDDSAHSYDRCFYPQGTTAQLNAIMASGDRTEALRALAVPTTVIHGRLDPLLTLAGGEATAAAIKDARLVVFDEMGHDLPELYWPDFVAEVVALANRADAR